MSGNRELPPSAIYTQPGTQPTLGEPPGSVPVGGVTLRFLRDTPEDAEFAASIYVEAFRGKITHNITERKLPIAVRNLAVNYQGQPEGFYRRTFVAELEGRPVGLLQLKFKGDRQTERDDHLSELGCWHGCRYGVFGYIGKIKVTNDNMCYVDHMGVEPSARGKGVGNLLLKRADYEARLRNCTIMYLHVTTNNRAKNLYEREGYQVKRTQSGCGLLGCFLGPPGKVYEMEKVL